MLIGDDVCHFLGLWQYFIRICLCAIPNFRIARRANTIANLARVISERKVSRGLRQTLLTQARRLEKLAAERRGDFPEKLDGDIESSD